MTVHNPPPPPPPLPPDILSDPPSAQASFGDGNNTRPRERRFMYEGKEFDDPGSTYSIREVMAFMAQLYPELANGSWTKTSYSDYDQITFYKVTGEKGLDNALRRRAQALSWTTVLLDVAEEAEETDWAWRSALSRERFAAMWQEVIEVEERKAGLTI